MLVNSNSYIQITACFSQNVCCAQAYLSTITTQANKRKKNFKNVTLVAVAVCVACAGKQLDYILASASAR